jgi:hypothetical protein
LQDGYVKSRSYYKRILLIIGDRLGWWCEGGGTRKGKREDLYKFLAVTGGQEVPTIHFNPLARQLNSKQKFNLPTFMFNPVHAIIMYSTLHIRYIEGTV